MKIIVAVLVVLFGVGGFFGGMQYQKTHTSTGVGQGSFAGQNGQRGQFRQGRNGNGQGAPIVGQILSQDANSVTIKLQDGSSKIVLLAGSSTISKTDQGTKDDLTTGQRVAIFGTTNNDGSVTAQNIQINPMFRLGASPRPTQ